MPSARLFVFETLAGDCLVPLGLLLGLERRADIVQMRLDRGAGGGRVARLERVVDGAVLVQQRARAWCAA